MTTTASTHLISILGLENYNKLEKEFKSSTLPRIEDIFNDSSIDSVQYSINKKALTELLTHTASSHLVIDWLLNNKSIK